MEIAQETQGYATIFTLKGRLDSGSSPSVEEQILAAIGAGSTLMVLDFSSLEYISSAGIRVLVHCHKEIEKKGGQIILIQVPKAIENVLYITGFLPYFKIFDNRNQALEKLVEKNR